MVIFAMAGGFAVATHGHVRAMRDLDFLVRLVDREAARSALESVGYTCTFQSQASAHFERHPPPELPGLVERAELLFSSQAVGQRAKELAMRQPSRWTRGTLPVVLPDTLLLMKLMAFSADLGRLQDLVDVRALLAIHVAALDMHALRETAADVGSDVLSLLDAEIGRASRGVEDAAAAYGVPRLGP